MTTYYIFNNTGSINITPTKITVIIKSEVFFQCCEYKKFWVLYTNNKQDIYALIVELGFQNLFAKIEKEERLTYFTIKDTNIDFLLEDDTHLVGIGDNNIYSLTGSYSYYSKQNQYYKTWSDTTKKIKIEHIPCFQC